MPSFAGLRHFAAALVLIVCAWRADAATARAKRWEARFEAVREWGEAD